MLAGLHDERDYDFINPHNLKKLYLRGLDPLFRNEQGIEWEDDFFWYALSQGLTEVQERASIAIAPKRRVETHDYHENDVHTFYTLHLSHPPVYEVESVKAVFPYTQAAEGVRFLQDHINEGGPGTLETREDNVIYSIPLEWIRIRRNGAVQIVTTWGSLDAQFFADGGRQMPIFLGDQRYLPQLWQVTYISGFHNARLPGLVVDAVFKAACIEVLTVLSDTVRPPGVKALVSDFDGVRRQFQFETGTDGLASMFTARCGKYRRDLYGDPKLEPHQRGGLIQRIRDRYQGIILEVA